MVSLILVFASTVAAFLPTSSAFPATAHDDHSHVAPRSLPSTWYHADDHAAHALFRRDDATPAVGSAEWVSQFPAALADPSKMPKEWSDALAAAVAANKIPNIPPSTIIPKVGPVYDSTHDPNGQGVCSATYKCRHPDDIWDAPDGVFAVNFDDGPLPESEPLYQFLQSENQHATHFMIGLNIIRNQKEFMMAFKDLQDDIAAHTWSHPYMTSLTNEQVVAELGFTLKAISDLTGGRLPRYWRPPYGDSDNRVRAIALSVFGLETIIWNQDTEDWSLTTGGTTPEKVAADLHKWITGPKSPGLNILEHELSNMSVQAFIDAFPLVKANGWKPMPVTQMTADMEPYRNADDDTSSVTDTSIVLTGGGDDSTSDASSASPSASVSGSTSASSTSGSSSVSASSSSKASVSAVSTSSASTSHSASSASASPSAQSAQANGAFTHSPQNILNILGMALLTLALSA